MTRDAFDNDNPIPLIGYSDKLSVQPGQTIRFMVSSDFPQYRADIVRMIHADDNPKGPGFKEQPVKTDISGTYKGKKKNYPQGSYVIIPVSNQIKTLTSFTIEAWIFPTTPQKGVQGIVTNWDTTGSPGYGLFIDSNGSAAVALRDVRGKTEWISAGRPLNVSTWYFVACSYDASSGEATIIQEPAPRWPINDSSGSVKKQVNMEDISSSRDSILIGANWDGSSPTGHFNGKIDGPKMFSRALSEEELHNQKEGTSGTTVPGLVASWDFSQNIDSDLIVDISTNHLDGRVINYPKRAVTGHSWTGKEADYKLAQAEYGAIHFHDDDLEDCGWCIDFEFRVPEDFKSGVYAVKLEAASHKDYIPFFVRPLKGASYSKIAFLAPTLTALAYGNEHYLADSELLSTLTSAGSPAYPSNRIDRYVVQNSLLSLYDKHSDRSGVCYVSRLRPILSLRPDYKEAVQSNGKGAPHTFPADLWITDWMEVKGFEYDVITDEDLHWEGLSLLTPYNVVITGTHPEYWTEQMLDAMERYLNQGGRLMYMGGNGFYWVTSIDPKRRHVVEIRRWGGTQNWRSPPGEYYHSTTGELGGLWRNRNRAPQKMVGVGFTSAGADYNRPYKRLPDSFNSRAAFIFEGIGNDEIIGDFDNLDQEHGAAGYEFDRFDHALGTPLHALHLASASGFSDAYQLAVEELNVTDSRLGGTTNEQVRADMVYFEYPNGGAVFSTGSVTWSGCLSYNGYRNNVSRVTENVLRNFASDRPK